MSTTHGDISVYNGTGYEQCWDDNNASCGMVCQRTEHAETCWEEWPAKEV